MEKAVELVIAESLGLPLDLIHDDLKYQDIRAWDSLAHVSLILRLEDEYNVVVSDDDMEHLSSVREIKTFISERLNRESDGVESKTSTKHLEIKRGLTGVAFDRTEITHIDGKNGVLLYRGYSVNELVRNSKFEETAYLLIYGKLPDEAERLAFDQKLRDYRTLSQHEIDFIYSLRRLPPLVVLRTVISANYKPEYLSKSETINVYREIGIKLISQIPTIIATHHAFVLGRDLMNPCSNLSHVDNFLYMLSGKIPTELVSQIFEKDLIIHMDHSSNASTFGARIAIGAQSDIYSAVTAAISIFFGKVHGGAIEEVLKMIDEIGTPDNVEHYVKQRLQDNLPIMGFGHRVYKVKDPRAALLRDFATELCLGSSKGQQLLQIVKNIEVAMQRYSQHGVHPNVDLYSGIIYDGIGFSRDLSIPIFVSGRIVGWVAQVLEQLNNNILIRPLLHYVGPAKLHYPIPVINATEKELKEDKSEFQSNLF
ncbi:citrate/2-methylcitrate synthase [Alicyclobacillus sp. SO9]|uniref:citrate/2-methylcitrate synthase n=1 Tax=Alicyclobacillus sp. SO9 TaxID=2665646 RepID=UPI0018E8AEA6|nr:citrate/2-methylcitrate synthase [Alicyclobacillus sp. SO9]QQE79731.1 citrate synthase [Alicyclobacillus sp. SO9]